MKLIVVCMACVLVLAPLAYGEGMPAWVPEEVVTAARSMWENEINSTSLEMLQWKFGFDSREEGLACLLDNPVQYVKIRYDQYIQGEGIEPYIEAADDFEFAIYNDGRWCGSIRIKKVEGSWVLLTMGLSQGKDVPDVTGAVYERLGKAGGVRVLGHESFVYFVERNGAIKSVLKWNDGAMDLLERDPATYMAGEKMRLERMKQTPMQRQLEEMRKRPRKGKNIDG